MAYGLGTRASIEERPIEQVSNTPNAKLRGWLALSEACRLEVVEQALRAVNDRIDGYPLAL